MATLDGSAVNLILPSISKEFQAPLTRVEWVTTIYLLVISILLLPIGTLASRFGQKFFFQIGIFIFTISSLFCAVSSNLPLLILSRSLQGVGAAFTASLGAGIIASVFPESKRGMALGSIGMTVAAGSITGPVFGGFVAGVWSWEAIFWINVPIGFLVLWLSFKWLPRFVRDEAKSGFDLKGALLYAFILIFFLLALSEGTHLGLVYVLLGIGVSALLFFYFIRFEKNQKQPMLPMHLFQNRSFTSAVIFGLLNNAAGIQSFLTLPFYLHDVRKLDVTTTGLLLSSWPIALAIFAPISGRIADRIGTQLPALIGPLIQAAGLLMLAFLSETSSLTYVLFGIVISGIGGAIFVPANNKSLLSSVPQKFLFLASSIMALIRNIGMVSGIAIAAAIVQYFRQFADIPTEPSGFLYGMHWSMLTASVFALITGIGNYYYTRKKTDPVLGIDKNIR